MELLPVVAHHVGEFLLGELPVLVFVIPLEHRVNLGHFSLQFMMSKKFRKIIFLSSE